MERSKKFLTGLGNQYYRATYKSMGFTSDDLTRPIIGIANSWSESDPGHFNLRQVAQRVRDGIYRKFALKNEKIMDKNGSICEREKIKIHFTEMLDD